MPTELRTDADDLAWSVNIKRGLINLLNLNLQEHGALETVDPETRSRMLSNVNTPLPDELNNIFHVYEEDIVGECETIYAINEDTSIPEGSLFVNKIRNYDNCKVKPVFRNGIMANFVDIYPYTDVKPEVRSHLVIKISNFVRNNS